MGWTNSPTRPSASATAIDLRFWAEWPWDEYSRAAECTAFSPSSVCCSPGDRASNAAAWLANRVSPPKAGVSTA